MSRVIYTVSQYQVVVSQAHPEGLWSKKAEDAIFDSKDYDGDPERTFEVAEANYRAAESAMLLDSNQSRKKTVIMMVSSEGRMIYHRTKGAFPIVEPEPEPEEQP